MNDKQVDKRIELYQLLGKLTPGQGLCLCLGLGLGLLGLGL